MTDDRVSPSPSPSAPVEQLAGRATVLVVFSEDGPHGGNPCPVVLDADDLSDSDMQAVAAHFGHESAFVLTPSADSAAVRLRYFVPRHEMEMCVHATVAAVSLLHTVGRVTLGQDLVVETPLGSVAARLHADGSVEVDQLAPTFGPARHDALDELASVLGCERHQLVVTDDQPAAVSVSRAKLLVELDDAATLHGLAPDAQRVRALCESLEVTGLYPWAREGAGAFVARQFPRDSGYLEDPATGLAAAALGALAASREHDDGSFGYTVRQGQALGRPSVLGAVVERVEGRITRVAVRGRAELEPGTPA